MNAVDAVALLEKYFPNPPELAMIVEHSRLVAAKALQIAGSLGHAGLDLAFIEEAALLHDIGVCRTAVPDIGCYGSDPYIRHGVIGREILEAEGLPRHALVCERHIGVGLTVADIKVQNLPLPEREMTPVSLDERIICFADLFYSKRPGRMTVEASPEEVRRKLAGLSTAKVLIFDGWYNHFVCPPL